MVTVEVEYDYEAELQDELTIQSGDILTSVKQMSGGWWEGVLKGKRGLFPENFVKVLKTDDVTQPPPTSVKPDIGNTIQTLTEGIDIMGKKEMERANQSEEDEEKLKIEGDEVELRKSEPGEGKRCRVLFSYQPAHDDELDLAIDQVVDFLGEVEDGWWKGRSKETGKIGVFPSNFVEMCAVIESPKSTPVKPNPNNKQHSNQSIHQIDNQTGLQNLAKKNSLKNAAAVADKNRKNESNNGISNTVSSGKIVHSKAKLQTGIEKKKHSHLITTSSVQSVANKNDDKSPKAATEGKPNFPVPRPTFGNLKPTKMENNNTDGPQNAAIGTKNAPRLPPKPIKEQCVVLFPYTALNDDELSLAEGQIVSVITKDVEDKGWWKGELDGKIGVFPDNFVKLLSTSTHNTNATPPGQIVTSKLSPANKPSTTNEEGPQKLRKSFSPSQPSSLISSLTSSLNSASANHTKSNNQLDSSSFNDSKRRSSIKTKGEPKKVSTSVSSLDSLNSTPTKNSLPPSGLVGNSNAEARLSQPKGVVGGISIFGNAGPDFMASMKEKSSSLTKVGSNGALNGITGKSEGDPPKKRSFGKGTPAPAQPKPKAPSLPSESSKPTEHRSSRNLSSGGNSASNIKAKAEAFMAELRSKSSEDLASSKQKSRDRSSSSSSLKGSRKSPQKDTNISSEAGEEEKGVDFDSFLSGNSCNTHEKDAEEGKLVHLTANRAKAPKRRPPSSHFTTNNTSREDLSTASQKKDSQVTSNNDSVEDVSQATEESSQPLEEEDNDASEVVLRKRIGAPTNIPTASSPSADVVNSSIHMSLSINPVVEPEKSNKEPSKKPEWLAELSRKQQHRKSEKFLDHSKRPVVDNTSLKPTRHSMAPFGIHSLNRQGGIGNRDLPTSCSSDNLEDLTSSSSAVRPPINRVENIESTSVNGMINSRTKPIIQPAPEKPHVPLDKPHIPSKPISAAFNKDSGATNENIGGRTLSGGLSSRLTTETKSDSFTKTVCGSNGIPNSYLPTTQQAPTHIPSSKQSPEKSKMPENESQMISPSSKVSTIQDNETTTKRLGTQEPESQLASQTVKATPYMIPNEPSMAVVSSVATKLSSPDCVIPEQKTSPIHGGGWIRPSETNGDHGDTNMGGRVAALELLVEKMSKELEDMKFQLTEERNARQRLETKISLLK